MVWLTQVCHELELYRSQERPPKRARKCQALPKSLALEWHFERLDKKGDSRLYYTGMTSYQIRQSLPNLHAAEVLRPAEAAETRLIQAILDGTFAIDTSLPAERELAGLLGVTRPTLREALQRLARDGWVDIQHGKPTRVRNYWQEGNLGVLSAVANSPAYMPPDFVENLLAVRNVLAPAYTQLALANHPTLVEQMLTEIAMVEERPAAFAAADFRLHHTLTVASGNPVFTLILNGFTATYLRLAEVYFQLPDSRARSRAFYQRLLAAIRGRDVAAAVLATEEAMQESLSQWRRVSQLAWGREI